MGEDIRFTSHLMSVMNPFFEAKSDPLLYSELTDKWNQWVAQNAYSKH